jgi:L-asparaginase II
MATMFARLASPDQLPETRQKAVRRIVKAINAAPEMIAGTHRFNTDLIRAGRGRFVAKSGAEGVFCVGVIDAGIGICAKIDDGNGRPHPVIITGILKELGYLDAQMEKDLAGWMRAEIRNHRDEVCGRIVRAFELKKH